MGINTFIVEEHHEAFIVWSHALKNNILRKNSCLFHFDDHADFRTAIFDTSINELVHKSMDEIKTFVYQEMKIDTFIAPAIYWGLFDEFIWIKNGMRHSSSGDLYMRSYNNEGKKLAITKGQVDVKGLIPFRYKKLSSSAFKNLQPDSSKAAVLDIDLDYFSCCEIPSLSNTVVIEITESEYHDFINNRYHYLNFVTGFIKAVHENGSFFYVLNGYKEKYISDREVSIEVISSRIDELVSDLETKNLKPDLITICRSRFSGFTPEHQWEIIEDTLLSRLSDIYELDIRQLNYLTT